MAKVRKRTWRSGGETKSAWIVDYFDRDRVRRQKTFPHKKAADAYLLQVGHEVKEGTHIAPAASITVADAAKLWLTACELHGLEPGTLKQYRGHVQHHIAPLLGMAKLADLSTPRVQRFADALVGRPMASDPAATISRSMAQKVLTSVKSILKEAQRQGQLSKDPARPVSIRASKRGTRKIEAGRDFPSKAEVNAILVNATGRLRPLIVTAIFTGMRASELRGLRWADVDLDAKVIHVRQRADAWGTMGPPKSETGERDIPLTPMVVNALREWRIGCPKGALDLVFPTATGRPQPHSTIANRGWYPLLRKAGIVDAAGKAKYGFHCLRHFFASMMIESGMPIKRLQAMLGHATMAMTTDVYGHLFPDPEGDQQRMAAAEQALVSARPASVWSR
jgi:integrase